MPRPQFTLRALLVAMLVAGAFFGGAAWQRRETERERLASEENALRAERKLRDAANEIGELNRRLREAR